jgi:Na+-transporting NADH:ubiquinone oxidoreductase subunit NqrF
VKLQRLVYQLKIEADADLMNFDDWEIKYDKNGEGFTSMPAGVKLECAAVISALLSETQTESVAGGVQCCSVCKTPLEDDGEAISCPECFEIMDDSNAKRRERSESRNGKDHTS